MIKIKVGDLYVYIGGEDWSYIGASVDTYKRLPWPENVPFLILHVEKRIFSSSITIYDCLFLIEDKMARTSLWPGNLPYIRKVSKT